VCLRFKDLSILTIGGKRMVCLGIQKELNLILKEIRIITDKIKESKQSS